MTPLVQGLIAGSAFGALTVAMMVPMVFPDKRAALAGAFINRFGIGFIVPLLHTTQSGWLVGVGIGLLLSLPSAIITKAYGPILVIGTIGGGLIGGITRGFS